MKKLAAVFGVLAVCLSAFVAYAGARPFSESQSLTRAAPSNAADGVSMASVHGFRVSVCAESGNTLSGAGTLKAYLYNPVVELWMRNPSLDVTVTATGERCQVFPDFTTSTIAAFGGQPFRVLFATSGVTVSGGTTVDVRIDAYGPVL